MRVFLFILLVVLFQGASCCNGVCQNQQGRAYMKAVMCKNMRYNHCLMTKEVSNWCTVQEDDCPRLIDNLDISFKVNFDKICVGEDSQLYKDCIIEDLVSSSSMIVPSLAPVLLLILLFISI